MKKIFTAIIAVIALVACQKNAFGPEPKIDVSVGEDAKYSTMKVISYNILTGMSSDAPNHYDNFVEWMNRQNPDVVALEECNGFSEASLKTLAARWGHSYVTLNQGPSAYNVAFTSRLPFTIIKKMSANPMTRGATHIEIGGINLVVLHLWPSSLYPANVGAKGSGDAKRLEEITYVIDQTIGANPEIPDWLLMGDFNCPSEYDKASISGTWDYSLHRKVLASGFYDLVHEHHNRFIRSTANNRIDFIYGTRTIASNLVEAEIIHDYFTETASDHFPVCVKFNYVKK